MFSINDKVVHSPEGVCIVENICEMQIDNKTRMVYMLRSVVKHDKVLYIPVDSQRNHFRRLKTREEIEQILTIEPDEVQFLSQNINKRANIQNHAIYEDDSVMLIKLIKLYMRRKEQSKLSLGDKNWLKKAEQFLFSEIAEVLECEYNSFLQNSHRICAVNF
ncbi:MAG: CarD family transcriptional regulator [Lachnospiraceae bacterium]|nr:CarD family transcriptional regulator [Lachnospiraceae bacterium]